MADDNKLTQADIDKAVKAAVEKVTGDFEARIEALDAKKQEALDEAKKAKAELRKVKEISPEDVAAIESERDKALADLAEANKSVKALTGERDKAVKALETEQAAARTYALDAEINAAIAEGNVVPALVPAFSAMIRGQAKAELVDGKYAVTIGDKAAKEHISAFLGSEDGKAFKAAAMNGGGGSPGSGQQAPGGKQITRAAFDALGQVERAAFSKEGGKVVDATA